MGTPPTTVPTFSGFLGQSASFVTPDDGFVLGVVSCRSSICLALRHTVDGGARWTSASSPATALNRSDTSGVAELHFADALDGWAYGAGLWVTHDGALDWHAVDLPGTVVAMASGAGTAYALVEPCPSSPCPSPGHLYRSPVGHDAWTIVSGVAGRFDEGNPSALVAEGHTVFLLATSPVPEILGSSDGTHFSALTLPCGPEPGEVVPFTPASLASSDPSDLAVACLAGVAAGSQMKEVYLSHDGGRTYLKLPDPPAGGDGAALAMPAPTTVLLGAASGATLVYRLAPPGTSWSTPEFFGGGGMALGDLAFVDPTHGAFIFGPATTALSLLDTPTAPSDLGALFLSSDGGAHWHLVAVPS